MPPNFASDVNIDSDTDLEIQGPAADTALNSLRIGNTGGLVTLVAGAGTIATAEGIAVGENGIVQVGQNGRFTSAGDLVNNGLIALGENAELIVQGRFSGAGTISGVNGVSIFEGQLSPGNSPGLLSVEGDVVLTDSTETLLEIAGLVRGDEYDAIDVGGDFTLDGTLNIVLLDGFELSAGNSFLLLQAGNLLGDFDSVNMPVVAGLQLLLNRSGQSLSLSVQPVPLPAAGWLLLCGLMLLRKNLRRTAA